ncbi:MAG: response regulator [Gammaproteobacteria bacterium]|jgi:DNA-binding response OmpR family regulator|nr:response regulator [Gammaproteobacteria bacterium]
MNNSASILIVDDQDDVRKLMRMVLEPEGYQLIEAHDGQSAINQIQKHQPDLILLDIMMPGYPNGLELLEMIRRNKSMTVKIVMVSAKGQYDDVLAAAKLNCDAYIVKPFTLQHLLDTIKNTLK